MHIFNHTVQIFGDVNGCCAFRFQFEFYAFNNIAYSIGCTGNCLVIDTEYRIFGFSNLVGHIIQVVDKSGKTCVGTAAGVVLSSVALPLLSVTPDGTAPLPEVIVTHPLTQILGLNLSVLLTLGAIVAVLSLGLRRVVLASPLRAAAS